MARAYAASATCEDPGQERRVFSNTDPDTGAAACDSVSAIHDGPAGARSRTGHANATGPGAIHLCAVDADTVGPNAYS